MHRLPLTHPISDNNKMKGSLICKFVAMLFVAGVSSQQVGYSQWKAPTISRAFKRAAAHTFVPGLQKITQDLGPRVASLPEPPSFSELAKRMSLPTMPQFPKMTQPLRGVPSLQWPRSSSTPPAMPSPVQQSPVTSAPPRPAPSTAPPTPPPTTANTPNQPTDPTPSSPVELSACSKTDTSPEAVLRCVNAVRTNPRAFGEGFDSAGCSWQSWINEVATPARAAFKANSKLTSAAKRQADGMARTGTVTHTGDDGSTVAQRIADAGFTTFPQAENVAGGQGSAYEVTMAWMCSEGHRKAITNCQLDSVGTWTSYDTSRAYFVQDFGCESGNCSC